MQRRLLIFLGFVAFSANAADHNTFKDCSRVSFCTNLRSATPDDDSKFSANLTSAKVDSNGVFQVDLKNNLGDTLTLELQLLNNDKYRVIIEEVDSKRYRLQEVLDGEPLISVFSRVDIGEKSAVLTNEDNTNHVEITASPLALNFYKNDVLVASVNDRLIFEKESAAFSFEVSFPQAETIYGIHEHADSLSLKDTSSSSGDPYRLRNLDVSGYELNSPMALYGAVPVLYGHGKNATAGVFVHNAAEQWLDISKGSSGTKALVMVETGLLDLFVLLGPTPKDVVRQYTNLTGVAHLPQLWTLGYHQCRWNYDTQEDVKNVVANFDSHDFPLDVIWLDIEYTDGKRYFTWNPTNFSDPLEMQQNISSTNRKLVTIIDPHIKVDTNYQVYSGALEKDLFVKNPDGSNFEGNCWPGLSSYMDFLNPEARDYYSSFYSYEKFEGSTEVLAGFWNDMNEPSVFDDSIEKTLPGDSLHKGGVNHRDIHNIYGLLHTKSTHQGLMLRDNGLKRPFVLSRSHFAGTQRYAMIWTGDNTADWGYLAISYPECLNANILGLVFCGADIGGFDGNPTEELLQRWYQAGAWLPFYRAHANMGTNRREPYLFSEDVQQVIRDAIKMRYKHLPVWYTLFFLHTRTGDPIIRPLFYHYPEDSIAMQIDSQLLLGSDILVKNVAEPEVTSVEVYFPGENDYWYQIGGGSYSVNQGGQTLDVPVNLTFIPVYYKSGSIVPRKETPRPNSEEMKDDPITLVINTDENNQAKGVLYVDDYTSFEYQNGNYSLIDLGFDNGTISISYVDGNVLYPLQFEVIVLNQLPADGKSGVYQQTVYTETENGQKLRDINIDLTKKMVLTF